MRARPRRLDNTLRAFNRRVRVAVEPRHPSWFCAEVEVVLVRHGAALCLADRSSRVVTPMWQTADWTYLRLHSGRARPESCYGDKALRGWVDRLVEVFGRDVDGYVYFNNDAHGCAVDNAITFTRFASRAGIALPGSGAVQGASSPADRSA